MTLEDMDKLIKQRNNYTPAKIGDGFLVTLGVYGMLNEHGVYRLTKKAIKEIKKVIKSGRCYYLTDDEYASGGEMWERFKRDKLSFPLEHAIAKVTDIKIEEAPECSTGKVHVLRGTVTPLPGARGDALRERLADPKVSVVTYLTGVTKNSCAPVLSGGMDDYAAAPLTEESVVTTLMVLDVVKLVGWYVCPPK